MRKFVMVLGVAAAIAAGPAFAEEAAEEEDWFPGEISGNVALTNNYMFRGISQTDNDPAIQGGLTYTLETGLLDTSVYGGFWGSNVDFNLGNDGPTAEFDFLFGLTGAVGETGLGWNLGGIYYAYPGASSNLGLNYWEINPGLSYSPLDWLSTSLQYFYSPDFFAGSGEAHYVNGVVKFIIPVPYVGLTIDAGTGHQWIEHEDRFGIGKSNYQDWRVGATLNIKGVDFSAAYVDTNLSKGDCGGTNLCEPKAVFAVNYAF